jgi:hypothetical protein
MSQHHPATAGIPANPIKKLMPCLPAGLLKGKPALICNAPHRCLLRLEGEVMGLCQAPYEGGISTGITTAQAVIEMTDNEISAAFPQ